MKKYIIANWKANKTSSQVDEWITLFQSLLSKNQTVQKLIQENRIELIICPSFPFISTVAGKLHNTPGVSVGCQNIASVEHGSFTGEVTAEQVSGLAQYAIIGHSERRSLYHETETDIAKKVSLAELFSLDSILCIRGEHDTIYSSAKLVAYEPVEAIGSGKNMPAEEVIEKKNHFEGLHANIPFLYGGSVTPDSAGSYLAHDEIDGLLIGSASLQADSYLAIAAAASV